MDMVYSLTRAFPKEEIYGLSSQMRRAAVSIPSNIAEGAARNHKKEFIQFLYTSLGSLSELETQVLIAERQGYVQGIEKVNSEIDIVRKQLIGLIKSIKI